MACTTWPTRKVRRASLTAQSARERPFANNCRRATGYLRSLTHTFAVCDRCMQHIHGEWFHCAYCPIDLCDSCAVDDTHDNTHLFVVFKSDVNMQIFRCVAPFCLVVSDDRNASRADTPLQEVYERGKPLAQPAAHPVPCVRLIVLVRYLYCYHLLYVCGPSSVSLSSQCSVFRTSYYHRCSHLHTPLEYRSRHGPRNSGQ